MVKFGVFNQIMVKRTKQIDDNREVELKRLGKINGKPLFTTKGQLEMQEIDKEQLSDNTKDAAFHGRVNNAIIMVEENAARFAYQVFYDIAPKEVVEAESETGYDKESQLKFLAWVKENQFEVIQVGIKTIIKVKGSEIASMTADIPSDISDLVDQKIRSAYANR